MAGSIFWTLEQMNQIIDHLARIGTCLYLVLHSIFIMKKQKTLQKTSSYMKLASCSVVCEPWKAGFNYWYPNLQVEFYTSYVHCFLVNLASSSEYTFQGIISIFTATTNQKLGSFGIMQRRRSIGTVDFFFSWATLQLQFSVCRSQLKASRGLLLTVS